MAYRFDLVFPLTGPDVTTTYPNLEASGVKFISGLNRINLRGLKLSNRLAPGLVQETLVFDDHTLADWDLFYDFFLKTREGEDAFLWWSPHFRRYFVGVFGNSAEIRHQAASDYVTSFTVVLIEQPFLNYPQQYLPQQQLTLLTAHNFQLFADSGGSWSKVTTSSGKSPFYWVSSATDTNNFAVMKAAGNSVRIYVPTGGTGVMDIEIDGEVVKTITNVASVGTAASTLVYDGLSATDAPPDPDGLIPHSGMQIHRIVLKQVGTTPIAVDAVEVVRPGKWN